MATDLLIWRKKRGETKGESYFKLLKNLMKRKQSEVKEKQKVIRVLGRFKELLNI